VLFFASDYMILLKTLLSSSKDAKGIILRIAFYVDLYW